MKNEITDLNSLYAAFLAARKNSAWKPQGQQFEWNFLSGIIDLKKQLEDETYRTSSHTEFLLNERGKTRPITGLQMQDRVVRHALCDERLTPAVIPYLMYDNGASQKGRGVDFQRRRLKAHLHRYFARHGSNEGYVLLIDFSKYYDNILHDKAMEMLEHYADPDGDIRWILSHIFDEYAVDVSTMSQEEIDRATEGIFNSVKHRLEHPERGGNREKLMHKSVQVGDQMSQIIGVSYPIRIDNYIKIVRGMKYAGRYMDDTYIISDSKEELRSVLDGIRSIAGELGIHINDKKTHICKISRPFCFLQHNYTLTATGHIVERIRRPAIVRMRRKLKKLMLKVKMGDRLESDIRDMFMSWMKARRRVLTRKQKQSLYRLYNELAKEAKNGNQELRDDPGFGNGNLRPEAERKQLHLQGAAVPGNLQRRRDAGGPDL